MQAAAEIRVLVIADPGAGDELGTGLVNEPGIVVVRAPSIAAAKDFVVDAGCDAVLVDLDCAGSEGLGGIATVHAWKPDIPVVAVTSDEDDSAAAAAIEVGAQDLLYKEDLGRRTLARAVLNSVARVRAGRERTDARSAYTAWLKATGDGYWEWDVVEHRVEYSDSWKAAIGFEPDEIGDSPDEWFDRVHSDDAARLAMLVDVSLEDDDPSFQCEFRIQAKNERWCWMFARGFIERDGRGVALRLVGANTDITTTRHNPCVGCGTENRPGAHNCVTCEAPLSGSSIGFADTLIPFDSRNLRSGDTLVDRYRIDRQVANGACGAVFRAERITDGFECAIKVLHAWLTDTEDALGRFAEEGALQQGVQHPNIVGVIDVIDDGQLRAIVMEFVGGPTLRQFMAAPEFPEDPAEVTQLFLPVLAAMELAHRNGIIHRDIKPENILVALDDGALPLFKLTDFGLAKHKRLGTRTMPGVTMGTARYMSPEQFTDARGADHRADIYSLACCLYELLTQRPIFKHETDYKMLMAHLNEEPDHPSVVEPRVPLQLGDAVMRAVSKEPSQRFASCDAFATELAAAL